MAVSFLIPPVINEGDFLLFSSSLSFGFVSVWDFGHSNWCVVTSHCFLNVQFLIVCYVENHFQCLFVICISICLFRSFAHFLIGLLNLESSFYSLDNSPLSERSFAHIYSPRMACLLILMILSFTKKKFFYFKKVQLINFSVTIYAFSFICK